MKRSVGLPVGVEVADVVVVEVEMEVEVAGTVLVVRVVLVWGMPSVGITTRVTLMHSRLTSMTASKS